IDDIQTELVENPVFEEMMEAQHCFANLMNEVNRTIGAYIGMNTEENSSSGCSGNCSGCSGCVH
ncbi:MAG: YlbF family regulator, partial [Eubacteriales bacterium]|nr:YlbF family regulator [Eubacteriales bacterium]